MGCLCHSRGAFVGAMSFAPATEGPDWPEEKTIRHWRERALAAEKLLGEKEQALSEMIDVNERQQRENAKLRAAEIRRAFR